MRTKGAKNKKYNFYCDMDGVLADFNAEPNALERFRIEESFFANLNPITENVDAINKLATAKNVNVFILSASPNEMGDNGKKVWLEKYLPNVKKSNIIIMRVGENKADFVRTKKHNVLFDDYGKNIRDFESRGYRGFKITDITNVQFFLNGLSY